MPRRKNISLAPVSPSVPEDQKALAREVDRRFAELTSYLRKFSAPSTETVGDVSSEEISQRTSGVFFQSFEYDIDQFWDQPIGDASGVSYPNNGSAGGRVLRADGEHVRFDYPQNLPYDSRRVYRLRCRVKITAKDGGGTGKNTFRWGVVGYAQDGETVVDRQGGSDLFKPHPVGADRDMNGDTLDTFVDLEAYITATASVGSASPGTHADPGTLQNDVVYVRPFVELNRDGGAGAMELDFVAFDILTVEDEIDAILTRNGPIEADAEQTAGKDFSILAARFFENLIRSSTDGTKLSVVVSKVDNAGDLEQFTLMDDGADKRVIAKGKQEGSASDGDTVSFDPAFQDTPAVFFRPTGLSFESKFQTKTRDALPSGDPSDVNLTAEPEAGRLAVWFYVSGGEVEGRVQVDKGSGFSTVTDGTFRITTGGSNPEGWYCVLVEDTGLTTGHTVRLDKTGGAGTLTPKFVEYVGPLELYARVVPDGLSASGFDLLAKLIERNISVTKTTETFGAGTLTTEGDVLALGGLSADAYDDEYRTFYDVDLAINSADNFIDQDDDFPSGIIEEVDEAISKALSAEASDDSYDVRYDVDMEVTAAEQGQTTTETFPAGNITTDGGTIEETLDDTARDGKYTVAYDVTVSGLGSSPTTGHYVSVIVESQDAGGNWVSEASKQYSVDGTHTGETLSFTNTNIGTNDKIRVRLDEVGNGEGDLDPDDITYEIAVYSASIDFEIAVESSTDGGSTWNTEDLSTYSLSDDDGSSDTLSQSVTKSFIRDGVTDVRVRVNSVTESGSFSSQNHDCDPNDVQYQSGDAETATVQITVAVDSKDGTNAWVERGTKSYSLTDDTGTGTSKSLTGEVIGFVDSAITGGDDIRVRLKSVDITGNTDSVSHSVDPDKVEYNESTGTTTEHSKTPLTGDSIDWVALAG